jgi:hypothetical protein
LYVQPVDQQMAVFPVKLALHLAGSGRVPELDATSRPGQSPRPTGCQLGPAGATGGAAAAQVYIWPGFWPPVQAAVATLL